MALSLDIANVAAKELTAKFWEVAEQFKNWIHPNDLIIAR